MAASPSGHARHQPVAAVDLRRARWGQPKRVSGDPTAQPGPVGFTLRWNGTGLGDADQSLPVGSTHHGGAVQVWRSTGRVQAAQPARRVAPSAADSAAGADARVPGSRRMSHVVGAADVCGWVRARWCDRGRRAALAAGFAGPIFVVLGANALGMWLLGRARWCAEVLRARGGGFRGRSTGAGWKCR